jgi:hypothetical protein
VGCWHWRFWLKIYHMFELTHAYFLQVASCYTFGTFNASTETRHFIWQVKCRWNSINYLLYSSHISPLSFQIWLCTASDWVNISSSLRHNTVIRVDRRELEVSIEKTWERHYVHTCVHTYMHTHIHTHTHLPTYIYTYIHTYTHTYIHTYIHTYTHTYIPGCW